jgi:hypothetical protein
MYTESRNSIALARAAVVKKRAAPKRVEFSALAAHNITAIQTQARKGTVTTI